MHDDRWLLIVVIVISAEKVTFSSRFVCWLVCLFSRIRQKFIHILNRLKTYAISNGWLIFCCDRGWAKKRGTAFVHIFANYWPIFKIFYWHILQTVCNNVLITHSTTSWVCLYTTMWNINKICIDNDNNKQTFFVKLTKNTWDQHCSEWSVWH